MSKKFAPPPLDMAAVARISRRVDLVDVRLAHVLANQEGSEEPSGPLMPEFSHQHDVVFHDSGHLVVASKYDFVGKKGEARLAHIEATYRLSYAIAGDDPVATEDLAPFATANGAYHSWPFVRELLHNLTARMGLPAFTLPVMSFLPPKPPPPALEEEAAGGPASPRVET